jgi:hypothetical protein
MGNTLVLIYRVLVEVEGVNLPIKEDLIPANIHFFVVLTDDAFVAQVA